MNNTPGPWFIHSSSTPDPIATSDISGKSWTFAKLEIASLEQILASVQMSTYFDIVKEGHPMCNNLREMRDNARLICGAPTMYKFLFSLAVELAAAEQAGKKLSQESLLNNVQTVLRTVEMRNIYGQTQKDDQVG